jgi:hypothetical protein
MPPPVAIDHRSFTWRGLFFLPISLQEFRMGCLPVPLFFLIGFGVGYLIDGQHAALWGAGIGLAVGLVGMGVMIKAMRGSDGR